MSKHPLAIYWTYTLLRVAVFAVLFALLWLFGVGGLVGAGIAVLLSVPLSYVLLARPRAALAQSMQERIHYHQERTADLDAQLSGAEDPTTRERAEPVSDQKRPEQPAD